jgi:hypothetical protein
MPAYICSACATQFPPAAQPPSECPICRDERQFVPASGQAWTTMDTIARKHANQFREHEPRLIGIGTAPQFCIGQRALLLMTPDGNLLWDCISLLDAATRAIVAALGGVKAIAISHPHYYTSMVEWSEAFGAPIYLHGSDRQWVMRESKSIEFWRGDSLTLFGGVTLVRAGGHFAGGTVAHWASGAGGIGALLSGDIVMPIPDAEHVSFMRSYPNLIPLSGPSVKRLWSMLEPFSFETIYGPFFERNVPKNGKQIVARSVARYVRAVEGDGSAELS